MRMFPLGGVHFPHTLIPLRVFEPRYRTLMDEVGLSGDHFGVVLIERGFEVGGGDSRMDVGTAAELLEAAPLDDGTLAVVARGRHRIGVVEWLEDDPYPRADVVRLDEPLGASPDPARAAKSIVTLRALLSELGADLGSWDEAVPEEPVTASYHLAAMTPVGPYDAQRLLEAATVTERLELVVALTEDLIDLARAQLGGR